VRNIIAVAFHRAESDRTFGIECVGWMMRETMRKTVLSRGIQFLRGIGMKKTYLFMLVLLFAPLGARASGGACPSDAQYINPANPTGALVTLASLGVTNCFYIAANGSDSNPGTSEASPWQHAPGMPKCVSGSACYITPAPGQGFILRGGDTWHYFTGSPQVGLPSGWPTGPKPNGWDWSASGTASNEIYIGVDKSWFAGSAWARPIFTNDNPTSTSPVSSCAFPQGNLNDITLDSVRYVQIDNFEFTGMCWNDSIKNNGVNSHVYLEHFPGGSFSGQTISNNYFHGWTHTPFTPSLCSMSTTPANAVCNGPTAIDGQTSTTQNTLIAFNICDGSDSDDLSFGCIAGDGYDVEENVMRHFGGTQILNNCHILANNLFEFINNSEDNATHSDMWFCIGEYPSDNFFYNNLIRFVGTEYNEPLSSVLWFNVQNGFTDYVFNNVGHDVNCAANCNNFGDPSSPHSDQISLVYNNTWESMNTDTIWKNQNATTYSITTANNHYITSNGTGCAAVWAGQFSHINGGNTSCSGDVIQTIAAANAQGYTSANDYAPTATSTATVGKGANDFNMSSTFGPAFQQTTTNGCAYNTANHTLVCPALTVMTRPASGPWDVGAYMSGSSNANQPPPPSNLAATVNN
jgi:hypothetical protein